MAQSVKLFIIGIDKNLHTAMQVVFVGDNMNWIAAVAAIFKIVLIITADIQRDMGWVTAKRAQNRFMDQIHATSFPLRAAPAC
jgi:hypothetical protein